MPDILQLEKERLEWSLKTFTEATSISSLRKCEAEIKEIEEAIILKTPSGKLAEEYVDALMCLLDSAGRNGILLQEIIAIYERKFEINKKRTWKKNPDNSYSHI